MAAEHFSFDFEKAKSDRTVAHVTVDQTIVQSVYKHIVREHKNTLVTTGFMQGDAPLAYVEYAFKNAIIDHLKEFFFTHGIINYLYHQIDRNHIACIGEPIITSITLDQKGNARYAFEFINLTPPLHSDWKRLPFKAPTRKNYKDLDRQVETFITDEQTKSTQSDELIGPGDWIKFTAQLVDHEKKPLLPYADMLWIKLGDETVDQDAYELFFQKKVGDACITSADLLQEYFSNNFDHRYTFMIEIKDRVSHTAFSLDQFKKQFKLKTAKDTHTKLIEAFSCRNDISQRRETIDEVFKLLFHHYPFTIPDALTQRQQEQVLRILQANPDYTAYKTHGDFKQKVHMLAEKQVKEHVVIGHMASQEQIEAGDEDVLMYLNLTKRPRMKEFIYFNLPTFKEKGQEMPIPHELIRYYSMHEKTLNHLINHLTKR